MLKIVFREEVAQHMVMIGEYTQEAYFRDEFRKSYGQFLTFITGG